MVEEQEGYGYFEYINGSSYEGHWKLKEGFKIKHGQGELLLLNNESYKGNFKDDQMNGYGTYKFKSGAVYMGEWLNGKAEGRRVYQKGLYEFNNGSVYDGDWQNHKLHGEGIYTDASGQSWEGEFVEGVYQSKQQIQLKVERAQKKKQLEILKNAKTFFTKFEQKLAGSEKKNMKQNLQEFFANQEETSILLKGTFPKYEEKDAETWRHQISQFQDKKTEVEVLKQNTNAKIIDPSNILAPQFNGVGQIVEFQLEQNQLVLCQVGNKWVIVHLKSD